MLNELWNSLWCHLFVLLRPMFKWILRKITGKCELLRISYDHEAGATRTKKTEKSLHQSRLSYVKQIINSEDVTLSVAVKQVMLLKGIVPEVHPHFEQSFTVCLCQICGYQRLFKQVEERRKVKYNSNDKKHEETLMKLWTQLMPDTRLESRISKQWTHIGFQGEDPATDFRGMGMLGLDQLMYFNQKYPQITQNLLSRSHHPQYGYSYAIISINFTSMCYDLLKTRKLRTHFYNLTEQAATVEQFHEVYCYLLHEFVDFWFEEKPKDIMEFSRLRDKFHKRIIKQLKGPQAILQAEFQKEVTTS